MLCASRPPGVVESASHAPARKPSAAPRACSARAPLAAASNPSSCLPLSPVPRCALCGADPAARPLESSSVQPLLAGRVPLLCVPAAPGPLPAQHLSPCVVLSSPLDCGRDVCPPASGAERASADVR